VKVLVLSDTFPPANLGGAGEVAELVSSGLAELGHEVLVVTAALTRAEAGRRGRVHRVWAPQLSALRLHLSLLHPLAVAQVRRVAAAFRPDVVHAHNVHERLSFASLAAARAGGGPLALTVHDYLLFCLTKLLCWAGDAGFRAVPTQCVHCRHVRRVPGRNRGVHTLVQRHVAVLACISDVQRVILGANGFGDVPRRTVYNGIDPSSADEREGEAAAFRRRHGLDSRPLVLFGGRISGAKGGDQLIRALATARRRVDCQLMVLGDRPDYDAFLQRIGATLGIPPDAIRPLGWLDGDSLRQAFAAADVCATPSVYPDPFNLMNLRAMAHRRPVVGTCFGGTPEIVADGVTGYLADPWDADAFGNRLADVLCDPERARQMGEAGRKRLEERFTLDRQVQAYDALLGSLPDVDALPATGFGAAHLPHAGS
jgi:glycosyltransferase involved in cell wall biosynthesis